IKVTRGPVDVRDRRMPERMEGIDGLESRRCLPLPKHELDPPSGPRLPDADVAHIEACELTEPEPGAEGQRQERPVSRGAVGTNGSQKAPLLGLCERLG